MSEQPQTAPYFCANHPDRETSLRCNRCEMPICVQCAIRTPTGYRCKQCVQGQQKVFETSKSSDFTVAFFIVAFLSFLGSAIASKLGFFAILIGAFAGGLIAEIVRSAVQRRRSRRLYQVVVVAAIVGGLPFLLGLGGGGLAILTLVYRGLYVFLVTTTLYYRLTGIEI
jgi:hypothetical protein